MANNNGTGRQEIPVELLLSKIGEQVKVNIGERRQWLTSEIELRRRRLRELQERRNDLLMRTAQPAPEPAAPAPVADSLEDAQEIGPGGGSFEDVLGDDAWELPLDKSEAAAGDSGGWDLPAAGAKAADGGEDIWGSGLKTGSDPWAAEEDEVDGGWELPADESLPAAATSWPPEEGGDGGWELAADALPAEVDGDEGRLPGRGEPAEDVPEAGPWATPVAATTAAWPEDGEPAVLSSFDSELLYETEPLLPPAGALADEEAEAPGEPVKTTNGGLSTAVDLDDILGQLADIDPTLLGGNGK